MKKIQLYIFFFTVFSSCKTDTDIKLNNEIYNPTPYKLNIPARVQYPNMPVDNPLTVEGIQLGRMLFYDVALSGDNTMSCASCHAQEYGFTDHGLQYSKGIDKQSGNRNSPPLYNLAWFKSFFWDGGTPNLESQVIGPVTNPIEMHTNFSDVINKLKTKNNYREYFKKAFGTDTITSSNIMKAIAQFERSIISFNAPFDKKYSTNVAIQKALSSPQDRIDSGFQMFAVDASPKAVHCWHCHGNNPQGFFFTDYNINYHDNGLGILSSDSGRYRITLNPNDKGFFKTPSLRNLAFTAPYMHDGRFKTLDEVIDFYIGGVVSSDPAANGQINIPRPNITKRDKENLKIFLLSLTDSSLILNKNYSKL